MEDDAMFKLISQALEAEDTYQGTAPQKKAEDYAEEPSYGAAKKQVVFEEEFVKKLSEVGILPPDEEEEPVEIKPEPKQTNTNDREVCVGITGIEYNTVEDDYEEGEIGQEVCVMSSSSKSFIDGRAEDALSNIIADVEEKTGLYGLNQEYMSLRRNPDQIRMQATVDADGNLVNETDPINARWQAGEAKLYTADILVSVRLLNGNGLSLEEILALNLED